MKTKNAPVLVTPIILGEMNKTLTFREITEADELEKAFRLRYEVYANSRCHVFLKRNQHHVDLDIFDLHAKHYGLFVNCNEMAGYIRVVLDKKEYYNNRVFEFGSRYSVFNKSEHSFENLKKSTEADYPFLSYPDIPEAIRLFYRSSVEKNDRILEASRLIIREDLRGLKTISFLVECAISTYVFYGKDYKYVVVDCIQEHSVFYKRFGFQQIEQNCDYNVLNVSKLATSLYLPLTLSSTPGSLLQKFETMANEYSRTGKITRKI